MPITEGTTDYGYYWRYDHPDHEPSETLDMAVRIAGTVAGTEARKSGRTYYVRNLSPKTGSDLRSPLRQPRIRAGGHGNHL